MVFGKKQTFSIEKDIPDLTGKVIIVTGSNKGLGYATVKHLALKGAKVFMAARNEQRAMDAIKKLESEDGVPSERVQWLQLDLTDIDSIKKAVADFQAKEIRLDVLINNAALLWGEFEKTKYGPTLEMMTNYVGPFLLNKLFSPILLETAKLPDADVRLITLGSEAHTLRRAGGSDVRFKSAEDFQHEYKGDVASQFSRYTVTKLCTVLHGQALQKRLGDSVTCLIVNPGAVYTIEDRASQLPLSTLTKPLLKYFMRDPDEAAHATVWAAASPIVAEDKAKYRGAYLQPIGQIGKTRKNATRMDLEDDLWNTTEAFYKEQGVEL